MKNKIIFLTIFVCLFLSGCKTISLKEPEKSAENQNAKKISLTAQINQALQAGEDIAEIDNPNLLLPADIEPGQIKKYFKIDSILFALVLSNSTNVALSLSDDFTPSFTGVLTAKQGDTRWIKFAEIHDAKETDKNNPYYLTEENNVLLLTVVDQNGAGSGEGQMKVFALTEKNEWNLKNCYYFGDNYNDAKTNGDYFAYSAIFSKQALQPAESCTNARIISKE